MNTVFLLTTGDGSDGNEWGVISIHSSRELAEKAKAKYQQTMQNIYGEPYVRECEIEEWEMGSESETEIPAERLAALDIEQ